MTKNIDITAVSDMLHGGATMVAVSKHFGVSRLTLGKKLKKAGLSTPGKLPALLDGLPVVEEYTAGATMRDLADKYGVSVTAVFRFLKKNKAEMRKAGRRATSPERAAARAAKKAREAALPDATEDTTIKEYFDRTGLYDASETLPIQDTVFDTPAVEQQSTAEIITFPSRDYNV